MSTRVKTIRTFHVITSDGVMHRDVSINKLNATRLGLYWNAIDDSVRGDPGALEALRGLTVTDRTGRRYPLLTDPDALARVYLGLSYAEAREFNATLYSVREVRRAS
jgi:hypothetical protein